MNRKQHYFGELLLAGDMIVLMVSYAATYWVRQSIFHFTSKLLPIESLDSYVWLLPILVFSGLIALRYFELYDPVTYKSPRKILAALVKTQTLAGMITFSAMFLLTGGTSRSMMGLFIVVSYFLLAAEKLSIYGWMKYRSQLRRPTTSWKVLLVGSHADAEKYLDLVLRHPDWNMEIVGIVAASGNGAPDSNGHGESHSLEH